MPQTVGWRCPLTGNVYARNDTRLAGYGNPPSSPEAQRQNPGSGSFPMQQQIIDMDELPREQRERVPSSLIIPDEPEPTPQDDA